MKLVFTIGVTLKIKDQFCVQIWLNNRQPNSYEIVFVTLDFNKNQNSFKQEKSIETGNKFNCREIGNLGESFQKCLENE